ncbi:MAG TPA: LPS export ABC transporter periplasmic protein LptC [Bacteroidaceae bacterium]|nr:LPS export ABC transporter periplasmic protein LptC [Bacteroidaceae bacterium]
MLLAFVMFVSVVSCDKSSKRLSEAINSRDSASVMTTRGITSLISEEGVIKYRIQTEEWEIFDKMDPPYWSFEKGVFLEVYDSTKQVESTVTADTAYYYSEKKLWELKGNVHSKNVNDEEFNTNQLFWDQYYEKVYSDSLIRIRQEKQIIVGIGFESDQSFTKYTIKKTEGVFPIKE